MSFPEFLNIRILVVQFFVAQIIVVHICVVAILRETDSNFTHFLVTITPNVFILFPVRISLFLNYDHSFSFLQIFDNYADNNGTYWHLCEVPNKNRLNLLGGSTEIESLIRPSPIHITSYLNTLHVREITHNGSNVRLNATVRTQSGKLWAYSIQIRLFNVTRPPLIDINYKYKLASSDDSVETCNPNPCQFGGKCVSVGNIKRCQCSGHYTGRFVVLTVDLLQ